MFSGFIGTIFADGKTQEEDAVVTLTVRWCFLAVPRVGWSQVWEFWVVPGCVCQKSRELLVDGFFRHLAARLQCFAWLCLKIASLWVISLWPHCFGDVSELFTLFSYALLRDFSSLCYGYNTLHSFYQVFDSFLLKKEIQCTFPQNLRNSNKNCIQFTPSLSFPVCSSMWYFLLFLFLQQKGAVGKEDSSSLDY